MMDKSYKAITDFIFIEDKPQKADIILIPGGSKPQLMERACSLFLDGYASLLLPSGGENKALVNYTKEWDYFLEIAKKMGIPEEVVLKEDKATNTYENALYSKKVIEDNGLIIKKALLVCKAFHARRALLTYQTWLKNDIEYIICPIVDDRGISRDNWYLDQNKIVKVMSEVEKIGKYFADNLGWIT
ncbi:MAG: YdcF family protein [Candidatus Paceibacterota bacterium]